MIKKKCFFEKQKEEDVLTIILQGEIDHHCAAGIRGEIDAVISDERPRKTVMDLSSIDFMDSSGLGLIMGRYALMQRMGGEFMLKSPNERILKIFELAGLERIIKIEK